MRILKVVAEKSAPGEKPLGVEEDPELGVGKEFKPVDVPSRGDPNMIETGVSNMSVSDLEVDSVEAFDEAVEEVRWSRFIGQVEGRNKVYSGV